jgi:hypothetical protein
LIADQWFRASFRLGLFKSMPLIGKGVGRQFSGRKRQGAVT